MIGHVPNASPVALTTLTDTVVLAALTPDAWDDVTDTLTRGTHQATWEGPGSLGRPSGFSGRAVGADRGTDEALATRTLRLPNRPTLDPATGATIATPVVAVGMRAYLNPPRDVINLADLDETSCYIVARVDTRTTSVLQRIQVVSLTDMAAVP